jgi:hypothetical protein
VNVTLTSRSDGTVRVHCDGCGEQWQLAKMSESEHVQLAVQHAIDAHGYDPAQAERIDVLSEAERKTPWSDLRHDVLGDVRRMVVAQAGEQQLRDHGYGPYAIWFTNAEGALIPMEETLSRYGEGAGGSVVARTPDGEVSVSLVPVDALEDPERAWLFGHGCSRCMAIPPRIRESAGGVTLFWNCLGCGYLNMRTRDAVRRDMRNAR